MITIKNQKESFQVRVAGVIQNGDQILLLNEPRVGEYWFLPGGRAEMHESSDITLLRELEEEMNVKARIHKMVWIIENFFTLREVSHHTIGFYYSVEIPNDHPLCSQKEYCTERFEEGVVKKFHFRWCSSSERVRMDIRPPCIKRMLDSLTPSSSLLHCVVRE
jgi:8-oxo-dGTP pyrophosphatase MutT (NUDIX family)